uniref:Uncharacterized protein MANES_10G116400 n=1 Tax=Rhizophora mucronata TaxID=61149 RepID=A0A2P2L7A5_RHIMU
MHISSHMNTQELPMQSQLVQNPHEINQKLPGKRTINNLYKPELNPPLEEQIKKKTKFT